ncbi:hypothetical protein AV654_11950 [Paenibacillus elgii]|uniref:Uncharacterized protein n=1 Tax=Paenibacillus elgii TaxID=189691 RepID=A0A161SGZ8_9BACL|nr:hypothetical protein [Paenibacillus elgii]KZE80645.1 hypothetical protein AV654_11950 [Paenibacillus elgii]
MLVNLLVICFAGISIYALLKPPSVKRHKQSEPSGIVADERSAFELAAVHLNELSAAPRQQLGSESIPLNK